MMGMVLSLAEYFLIRCVSGTQACLHHLQNIILTAVLSETWTGTSQLVYLPPPIITFPRILFTVCNYNSTMGCIDGKNVQNMYPIDLLTSYPLGLVPTYLHKQWSASSNSQNAQMGDLIDLCIFISFTCTNIGPSQFA